MRRKNWLLILILTPLLTLVVLAGATYLLWESIFEPKVRAELINAVKNSGQGELELERIEIASLLSPRLALRAGVLTAPAHGARLTWKRIEVSVNHLFSSLSSFPNGLGVELRVIEPRVEYRTPAAAPAASPATTQPSEGQQPSAIPQIAFQLKIESGEIRFWSSPENPNPTVSIQDLALLVNGSTTPDTSIAIQVAGRMDTQEAGFPLVVPFSFKTDSLKASPESVAIAQAQMSVLGVTGSFAGASDLKTQRHSWRGQINVTDLKSLPTPPQLTMVKSVSGPVQISFEAKKNGAASPRIEVKANVGPITAAVDVAQDDMRARGQLQTQLQVDAQFQDQLLVRTLTYRSDLSQMGLEKKGLFGKPVGAALTVQADLKTESSVLKLTSSELVFHQLKVKSQGTLQQGIGQRSDLTIEVLPTRLNGFERFLLPLKEHPLEGEVAARIFVQGDLSQPKTLNMRLDPLTAVGLTGRLNYASEDKKKQLSGPFRLDVKGKAAIQNMAPRNADLSGAMDISGLAIAWDDLFAKKGGEEFKLHFSAVMQKDLSTKLSGRLASPFAMSNFNLQVKPSSDLKGPVQLQGPIVLENLNLTDLTKRVGLLKPFAVQGWVKGKVDLAGSYHPDKAPLANDIRTTADLTFSVEQYQHKSPPAPPADPKAPPPPPPPPPEPFLPREPVFRNLKLSLKGDLKRFLFNDLVIQGISPQIRIDGGQLTGTTTIRDLFGGQLTLSKMNVPLLTAPARTQGQLSLQHLNLSKAVAWAKPEFKDDVKGLLNLETSYDAPLPGHGEMTKLLKAQQGSATVDQFVLSTLKLDEMINDLVKKIPGQSGKVNSKGVSAKLTTQFALADALFRFQNLDLLTSDRNQLKANGQAGMDMSLKMKGQLFVAGLALSPRDLECLGDGQGRVEIPIEYSGSITSPQYSAAAGIFGKLAEKYGACQLKQAQKDATKKIESSVKKGLEDLTKKKLKGIFGN